ncbi:T9SS type A sorting domain-containing protein [Flavitalea flava]
MRVSLPYPFLASFFYSCPNFPGELFLTKVHIRIINANGLELVSTDQNIGASGMETVKLNVQAFSAGVYIVEVNFGNETRTAKFIKSN